METPYEDFLPIETQRLQLRRVCANDLHAFQTYRSDPELGRYQSWEAMSADEARAFLGQQVDATFGPAGQWLQVAIVRRDTGELIGDVGLCVSDAEPGTGEIGYTLTRSSQGHGYATEAVAALLDIVLGRARVHSVRAVTDARNEPSIAMLRRMRFELESTVRTQFRGEVCDEHAFRLTAHRWAGRHAG